MTSTAAPLPARYVGLATRAVAGALDAAIINVAAVVVAVGVSLIVSVLHLPKDVRTALLAVGGAAYIIWIVGYFTFFWATTGQTPGNRIMQFRVVGTDGKLIKPRRAFVRMIGVVLAAIPLLAGYVMIPFNSRRRGLQDLIARTVVVEAPQESVAGASKARQREDARKRRADRSNVEIPATTSGPSLDSNS